MDSFVIAQEQEKAGTRAAVSVCHGEPNKCLNDSRHQQAAGNNAPDRILPYYAGLAR